MKLVAKFFWVALLLATLVLGASNAAAQSSNPCDTPHNLPPSFFEIPQGPDGNWRASFSLDQKQEEDPQIPVVVAGMGAIQGPANQRGMRLGCGLLKNRSKTAVSAVQLRWILIRTQDRAVVAQQGYTQNTVLQQGHTGVIELSIPQEGFRQTDFSIIGFADVTRPLLEDGILSGDYVLIVGVHEVRFEDGSVWKASPLVK